MSDRDKEINEREFERLRRKINPEMSEIEEKISKALHGVISPRECWHESLEGFEDECIHCECAFQREDLEPYNCKEANPDYFSKEGFVDLLEWLRNSECWLDFISDNCHDIMEILDYKTFAGYVHDFLKEHGIISQPGSPEA